MFLFWTKQRKNAAFMYGPSGNKGLFCHSAMATRIMKLYLNNW